MDSTDRKELDRVYDRLLGKWSKSQRQHDTLALAELQALMDRVRNEQEGKHDTDPMPPESCPQ